MTLPWHFTPLSGERVTLDLLRADDLDALSAIQGDPTTVRYMLYSARTRDEVATAIERDGAHDRLENSGDYVQPAIRDAAGRLVGTLYVKLASTDDRTAEIGWLLSPGERGKGYATEAAEIILRLAFEELGLHRVYAELDPRNEASAAVCERLGMRHEAHLRENLWLKGEWVDTAVYAILEQDYRRRRI
ncbi:GNAT family N-acetyltransferase [Microbacterium sp. bgisy207]|uniref:GNAT family N-acetyltransferase n=1 Tax=Microbacterium sp. bgisy207 TaxID=3413800 RepID=UPI003EBA01C9